MSIPLKLCILIPSFTFKKPIICRKMEVFAIFIFFRTKVISWSYFKFTMNYEKKKNPIIWMFHFWLWMFHSHLLVVGCLQIRGQIHKRYEQSCIFRIKLVYYNQGRVSGYFVRALGTRLLLRSLIRKLSSCTPNGNFPVGHCQQECVSGGMWGRAI